MKITEFIKQRVVEDYDQAAADKTIQVAMVNLAKRIKPKVYDIVAGKQAGKNVSNTSKNLYSDVTSALYNPYLRQSFNTPDTKVGFNDNQLAELINKYAGSKFAGINSVLDNANGWFHFYRNDRPPSGGNTKKFYQNINPSIDIKQFEQMLSDLIKYLGSEDAASTGFYGFKIPTSHIATEADPIVNYFRPDADSTYMSMGQSVISSIAGKAARVSHRGFAGTDNQMFKAKHFDNIKGGSSESDSTMLLNKFAEYLVDNVDKLYQYYETYNNDMNMMGKIFAKAWKDKFEKKDWTGLAEGENWSKHNNPKAGGMSKKSVSSYRRSHPGSKIKTAVTTKPSKLKKGSKSAKRRLSFCARMKGMKKHRTGAKTARDPNSNINKSLRRWNCESIEELKELLMLAEQFVAKHKKEII